MWFKAAAAFGLAAALAFGGWQSVQAIKAHIQNDKANIIRITQLEGDLKRALDDLAAERLANKLDAQGDLESFEKADWACEETVRRVVAATKIVPVPVKEYVYEKQVTVPGECPTYHFPPMYRVRDIQAAGADASATAQVPVGNEGNNRR